MEMQKRRRARTALVEADEGRAPAARRGARARRTRGDETTGITDDILVLMAVVRIHVVVPLSRAYGAADNEVSLADVGRHLKVLGRDRSNTRKTQLIYQRRNLGSRRSTTQRPSTPSATRSSARNDGQLLGQADFEAA